MPVLQACVIAPLWEPFAALLPAPAATHPLGCHRPRISDRIVFDQLVQVLVFGCAYHRIADDTCSATTLRRRRDDWMALGLMEQLHRLVLDAYDRMIGLELGDLAVDGCITKAPCGGEVAGRSPVERGKQGLQRSTLVDARGLPLGTIAAPANRHDAPLLVPTVDLLDRLGPLPATITVQLDRGDDAGVTRAQLHRRGLWADSSARGKPAPVAATERWMVERTTAWTNAHTKLVWCTERRAAVIAFWLALSAVVIIIGRLLREAWTRYRWEGRPVRKP